MSIRVASVAELPAAVGQAATGEWFEISQDRIAGFADVTEDWQWIHLDAVRAAAGPFGGTIAHGYLTLSLLPRLVDGLLQVDGVGMAVNYGLDKVRFLQPVRAGSRVRATTEVVSAEPGAQGTRVGLRTTVEIEGGDRPALVAETIALFVPQ
ncbi:MaoC family dehydratase [Microbacterium sp. MC2]